MSRLGDRKKGPTDPDVIRLVDLYLHSRFYERVRLSSRYREPHRAAWDFAPESPCGAPDAEGTAEWWPVDSPIDEDIAAGYERFLGVKLPPAFRSYLMYKCLINTDLYYTILPEIDPRHPLGWLEWSVQASREPEMCGRPWYIPFTYAEVQCGYLCFDAQRPDGDGDYPIMLAIDMNSKRLADIGPDVRHVEVHKNFRTYLKYICDTLEYMNGAHSQTQRLEDWLSSQGKNVPYEIEFYRSGRGGLERDAE